MFDATFSVPERYSQYPSSMTTSNASSSYGMVAWESTSVSEELADASSSPEGFAVGKVGLTFLVLGSALEEDAVGSDSRLSLSSSGLFFPLDSFGTGTSEGNGFALLGANGCGVGSIQRTLFPGLSVGVGGVCVSGSGMWTSGAPGGLGGGCSPYDPPMGSSGST